MNDNLPKPGTIQKIKDDSLPKVSPNIETLKIPQTPEQSPNLEGPKFQFSVVFNENIDEYDLQEKINEISKSLHKNEHVGSIHSPPQHPKLKDTPIKKNILIDNIKPVNDTPKSNNSSEISENFGDTKLSKFKSLLEEEDIDLIQLNKLSWSGIPYEMRSFTWKILTGYIPSNKQRRDSTLQRKRKEYFDFVNNYFEKSIKRTKQETKQFELIQKDVSRLSGEIFHQEKMANSLVRILYIWAIRHQASGYVQGLHDILSPFFIVFLQDVYNGDVFECDTSKIDDEKFKDIEADTFWCFTFFVDFIQDNYTFAQLGIQRSLQKLEEIMEKIDPELLEHLNKEKFEIPQFGLRWMNCLLMREIPFKLVIRMIDTYLSEGGKFSLLHTYVCAAFLKTWSPKLRNLESSELIMFLLNLPTSDWTYNELELLLSQAYMLKTLYEK